MNCWVEVGKLSLFDPSQVSGISNTHSFDFGVFFSTAGSKPRYGWFRAIFWQVLPYFKKSQGGFWSDGHVSEFRKPSSDWWGLHSDFVFFLYGQKMLKKENYTCNLCRIFRILHFWRVNEHMSQLVWGWWRGFSVRWVTEDMRHHRRGGFQPAKTTRFHESLTLYRWSFRSPALRQLCSDQNTERHLLHVTDCIRSIWL